MKSYTDIEQSRTLAEILPKETADQTWQRVAIAGANLGVPEEIQYRHNGDMPFQIYSGIGIPCWSLAALFDVIKNKCGYFELVYLQHTFDNRINQLDNVYRLSTDVYDVYNTEAVNACVEMLLKLQELKNK